MPDLIGGGTTKVKRDETVQDVVDRTYSALNPEAVQNAVAAFQAANSGIVDVNAGTVVNTPPLFGGGPNVFPELGGALGMQAPPVQPDVPLGGYPGGDPVPNPWGQEQPTPQGMSSQNLNPGYAPEESSPWLGPPLAGQGDQRDQYTGTLSSENFAPKPLPPLPPERAQEMTDGGTQSTKPSPATGESDYSGTTLMDKWQKEYQSGHLGIETVASLSPQMMQEVELQFLHGLIYTIENGQIPIGVGAVDGQGSFYIPDTIFSNSGLLAGVTDQQMLEMGWELNPDGNWIYNPGAFTGGGGDSSSRSGYGYGGYGRSGYGTQSYKPPVYGSLTNWRGNTFG